MLLLINTTINTNDTYNVIRINKLVNFNGKSYFAKKIEHNKNMQLTISQDIAITSMNIM